MALQITFEPRPSIHAAQRPMNSGNGQKVDKLGLGNSRLTCSNGSEFVAPLGWVAFAKTWNSAYGPTSLDEVRRLLIGY